MPRALVIPGVSVATRFEVPPPLPARSGILGAVGVVDRDPGRGTVAVTTARELLEIFGPATRFSFPEALSALANGVSEVIVSPIDTRSGTAASLRLFDREDEAVVLLRARAVGPWGNDLAVRVSHVLGADGETVRRVHLEVTYKGVVIERHENLALRAGSDDDLFNVINRDSQVLVAIDAVFETDLPVTQPAPLDLPAAAARAAAGTLQGAGGALIDLIATTPGRAGNDIRFEVQAGRASLVLLDAGSNPAIRIRARQRGDEGVGVRINATANPTEGIDVTVQGLLGATRRYEGFTDNAALVDALNADPDIAAERLGDVPPAALVALAPLTATRSVILTRTGVSTARFEDLTNAAAVVSALTEHGLVQPTLLGDATAALDATPTNAFALSGGRDAGRARGYRGQNTPDDDVLELVPLDSSDPALTRVQVAAGTHAGTVRVIVGVEADGAFRQRELFDDLTMDPDSERYLPVVLQASTLVRAVDLFRPSGATDFPHASAEPDALSGGAAPSLAAYQAAIDALEGEDAVDLLLTGLQEWKDPNLDGLAVQQYALGHARTQADNARPRIAIGSIAPSETSDIRAVTAHAGQVRDRRFVLVAPSGSEGALAGLLGHLEFFQSPTFKTLASLGADPHSYSDGELNQLLGPDANVCVLQQRKGRGLICVRGLSTSGDQISVTRVADRCVREVKAISDRFIGELNNAESRNALKQMIVATFTQLERDGALVPSVDNKEPAFIVDVYASQNDTAGGIVRVDIAVRPVRAIDYVYATITVKN